MTEPTGTGKLSGIEACRGAAATVVVLYHSARHLDHVYGVPNLMRIFQFGHAGVDLFFVISGFIILFVHYSDIDRPDRFRRYVGRRFTRILPTYWVGLALTVFLGIAGGHPVPPLFEVAWSATLLPSHNEPLLGVAWTLQFEIVFYAVFCLLILNRKIGIAIFAFWLAWIGLAQYENSFGGELPGSLYGMYNVEFFLGMGAAYWLKNHTVPSPRLVLIAGIGLFIFAGESENYKLIDGYANWSRVIYGLPSAMIILGVAEADRQRLITVPTIFKTLGAASYSIYLFQFVFIGLAWKLYLSAGLEEKLSHTTCFALLAVSGVAGGILASQCIEYPLMGIVRRSRSAFSNGVPQANISE